MLNISHQGGWGSASLERVEQAGERVRDRLLLATRALATAGVPYAVCGDWASQCHVARVEESAVRNCVDVEIIVRRSDFPCASDSLVAAGLINCSSETGNLYLSFHGDRPRNGIELFIAGERIRPNQMLPTPDPDLSENGPHCCVLSLDAFVKFALSRFRTLDRVHIRDLLDVHAVSREWLTVLPPPLSARLKEIIEDPRG